MNDAARTSAAQTEGTSTPDAALVLGGSIAGLLAARVLADHFERVTVVERDTLPTGPELRSGVPQARHVHVLLMRGLLFLEDVFPGIRQELERAGALVLNWTSDWAAFSGGRWAPRYASEYVVVTCSRALLEATIRNRLRLNPRVQLLQHHEATGLLATADSGRVCGVTVQARPGAATDAAATRLPAALVVDASGRGSRAPEWLVRLGYQPPAETTIDASLGYSSRWYRRPVSHAGSWRGLLISAVPPTQPRSGVIYPVEGGRWVVTLGGTAGMYPPTDPDEFLEFAKALAHPAIYRASRDAEPLTQVYGYRRTENRVRHYERLARLPDGLVMLGDAVCAFNPIYGQGMTVAALGAETLGALLAERRGQDQVAKVTGLTHPFQRRLVKVSAPAWLLATGSDLSWPTTVGGSRSWQDTLVNRYVDQVLNLTTIDEYAHLTFTEVAQMLRPPAALFAPPMIARVARQAVRRTLPSTDGREQWFESA
jgi:2-polyprenyl-6-methoxyphenol hydroxylase-like FAD-dependent oxidoreductase